jgi:hypothetical protein
MRGAWTPRRWIGAALVLQAVGFAYDALWHGFLHPGAEPQTRQEMVRHLVTVHLPLYIGVLSVLATTAWGFAGAIRHSRSAGARSVAAFGALLSAVGETWHAAAHLQLNTARRRDGRKPVTGGVSHCGRRDVAGARAVERRCGRRRSAPGGVSQRRRLRSG